MIPRPEHIKKGRVKANDTFGSDDFRSTFHRFTPEALKANQTLLDFIQDIAKSKNAMPSQIALAWIMAQKPFIVPIPGMTEPQYLEENIGAIDVKFTKDELKQFNEMLSKIQITGDRLCDAFNNDISLQDK